jgi:ferredoxin
MDAVIYYYTGTGNSLWTAKRLSSLIGGAELIPMAAKNITKKAKTTGFVFPVHIWGVPVPVLNFIKKLEKNPDTYYFAAAVNAGQVSRTLIQLQEEMKKDNVVLSAGFDVVLPSNYVPWGGPGTQEEIQALYKKAEAAVTDAAAYISAGKKGRIDRGPLWQRIVFTWAYNGSKKYINYMDKSFWADDKCNSCGICEKVCPAKNITIVDGKPKWNQRCEQCLACIQWCPVESIQYGKKTHLYARYHHESVKVSDLIGISKG